MMTEINAFFLAKSAVRVPVVSILLVLVIGIFDDLSGFEISFSIFYLIPVFFASWYSSQFFGIIISAVSAAIWLFVDYTSGHMYSHWAIPIWNAFVRLGFFLILTVLIKNLQNALAIQASLAEIDGLTGLLNARTYKIRCSDYFLLTKRNKRSFAIGYLDIDGFKGINDTLGHSVGDNILKAVAGEFAKNIRASDIAARLGGDEFSILLRETDAPGAKNFFSKLHEKLLALAKLNHWPVGFSIGVATFHSSMISPDEAIKIADSLMYKVKSSGKNHIRIEEYDI